MNLTFPFVDNLLRRGRADDLGAFLFHVVDGTLAVVIGVRVGDQDDVDLPRILRDLVRIDADRLASQINNEA